MNIYAINIFDKLKARTVTTVVIVLIVMNLFLHTGKQRCR